MRCGALHVVPLNTWNWPLWSTSMHHVVVGHCSADGVPISGSRASKVQCSGVDTVTVTAGA